MCLILLLGSDVELSLFDNPDFRVAQPAPEDLAAAQWLNRLYLYSLGAHTGCACGFRHIVCEEPMEYFEGMFDDDLKKSDADLRSASALIEFLRTALQRQDTMTLFPFYDQEPDAPPKGRIARRLAELTPDTLFFIERFLYEIGR